MNKVLMCIAFIAISALASLGPASGQIVGDDIIVLRPGALSLQNELASNGALKELAKTKRELAHIIGDGDPPPWLSKAVQASLPFANPIAEFLSGSSSFSGVLVDTDCGDTISYFLQGNELIVQSGQRNPGQPQFNPGFEPDGKCLLSLGSSVHFIKSTGEASQFPIDTGLPGILIPGANLPVEGATFETNICGTDGWEPSSHCGFYTVQLSDTLTGIFCSGVLISPMHILTAAHCVCERLQDGVLDDQVFASIGTGWLGSDSRTFQEPLELVKGQRPDFFDDGLPAYCQSGLGANSSLVRADLVVLHLTAAAFGAAKSSFGARNIVPGELDKLIAAVGNQADSVWGADTLNSHFHTFGFGEGGPGQSRGVKRSALYTARSEVPCPEQPGDPSAGCGAVKEVYFHDVAVGICAGDSGGGVFKFADPRPSGRAPLALMGILSGTKSDSPYCQTADGAPLISQHRRNIVRVDTPEIHAWLSEVTDASVIFVDVKKNDLGTIASLP